MQNSENETFCKELFKLESSSCRVNTQQFTVKKLLAGEENSRAKGGSKTKRTASTQQEKHSVI